jgi:alcohol dehydrogenase
LILSSGKKNFNAASGSSESREKEKESAEFNLIANPRKYARVALAMGEHIQGMTELEAACQAIDAIKGLCRDLGIPERLREINASEDKLPEMAGLCEEAGYNRWNPRHSTYDDFLNLFKKAF